ncbi:MAG: hypothetical protein WHS43_04310 [Aquificaceae bacterium]|jgi:methionyl-tRNA formyltransferase|uniref:methionyl-tRNA formyltransferase n=1 Tax=Hydrogenobacter sp. Uz 6-8 TaxID=3384828 RepID=UPI0030980986
MKKVLIATIRRWNVKNALRFRDLYKDKYQTHIVEKPEDLNEDMLYSLNPDYVFFPHWSWMIPEWLYTKYNCIGFHIGDLPEGRGGSPLQNHIIRKIYRTKITAFRISGGIDEGDIFLKHDIWLELGTAEELFIKISNIIFFSMIPTIIECNITPYKQEGKGSIYRRLKPENSNILDANISNLEDFYDFIRMLDAEDYPKAFIKLGKLKIEFTEAVLKVDKVVGRFEVIEDDS